MENEPTLAQLADNMSKMLEKWGADHVEYKFDLIGGRSLVIRLEETEKDNDEQNL